MFMLRQSPRGFTLLEILVVVVIIGLMAGAMVMIGSDNRAAVARDEIEQLNAKMKLALEEAQLNGVELGLVVTEHDYRFVTFGNDRWSPISDDKAYQLHRLPDGFELALEIEGFKLAGARLPGARITDEGKVVTDDADARDSNKRKPARRDDLSKPQDSEDDNESDLGSEDGKGAGKDGDKPGKPKSDKEPETLLPQVFLLSSGELNPFVLAIGNRDRNPVFYRLRANADGNLRIEGPIQADPVSDLNIAWDNPDPNAVADEDESENSSDGDKAKSSNSRKPSEKRNAGK
ncbi:type II secretion system protein [Permianibacter sp. IMCC34836]|uniref:type II secretion system protein n=1 Tax=Permianibacter fluminis TaxID=2738515 RepID=UPI001555E81A|nr:type II secretion system protein [Permianibacter fluminis]NQD35666.1 type II secretion system protein [Permianibacter fluminis]